MRVQEVKFSFAKNLYNNFHRTNKAPIGHKKSYVGIVGNEWNKVGYAEILFDSLYEIEKFNMSTSREDIKLDYDDSGELVVYTKGKIVGIITIGRPTARFNDKSIFEITRICFVPSFVPNNNKEKKYPSKLVREAIKMYIDEIDTTYLVTYIHNNQSGKYLKYAGFQTDKKIIYNKDSKGWSNRKNRSTPDLTTKIRFVRKVA